MNESRARLSARAVLLLAVLVAGISGARAGEPVVLELFTSQGCSSCPPADAYLGELAKRDDVLPLGLHVDYWNYIGWDDPFASKEMTHRQKDYQRTLNQRYVYTPEMVVDGAAHASGADRAAVEALIAHAKAARAANPGPSIALQSGGAGLTVRIGAGNGAAAPATVWLAEFDREHRTEVPRGENAGRAAVDYQVVRQMKPIGTWTGAPLELAAPVTKGEGAGGCAVILQSAGTGKVLAAAQLRY